MEAQLGSTIPSQVEVHLDITKLSLVEVHLDIAKGKSIKDSLTLIWIVLPEMPDSRRMVTNSIQVQACREQLLSLILICTVLPEMPVSRKMVTKSIQVQACREQLLSLLTNIQDHLIQDQCKLLNKIEELNLQCLHISRTCLKWEDNLTLRIKITNNNKDNQSIQMMECREHQLSLGKVHQDLTKGILNPRTILSSKSQSEMLNTFKMETKSVQIKACRELQHSPHLKTQDHQMKCNS